MQSKAEQMYTCILQVLCTNLYITFCDTYLCKGLPRNKGVNMMYIVIAAIPDFAIDQLSWAIESRCHGRPQRRAVGYTCPPPPPLELEKDEGILCSPTKHPKIFACALGARNIQNFLV